MTITLTRKEAQRAADALDGYHTTTDERKQLIETLRARLAQLEPSCKTGSQCIGGKCPQCVVDDPERCKHGVWAADHCYECEKEPEPVAWMNHEGTGALCVAGGMDIPDWKHLFPTPLYVAPPQREWVGLTAYEIASIPLDEHTLQTAENILREKNT